MNVALRDCFPKTLFCERLDQFDPIVLCSVGALNARRLSDHCSGKTRSGNDGLGSN